LLVTTCTALGSLLLTGCKTSYPSPSLILEQASAARNEAVVLREGDVVNVTFPGAPDLSRQQTIRRDGKISLAQVGDITAAGKTPANLEKEVLKLYEKDLVVKQVSVTLGSSAFPVFVIGAVLRPGKITADRPLSVFEAIMEAGGFDFAKANLKQVMVLREGPEETASFTLNLRDTLDGKSVKPFYLKPSDVVYVREKFTWF
jgi:polysaccharide export outer membrane protein